MKLKILSERAYQKWPSWHVVYEWEDIIAEKANIPIVNYSNDIGTRIHSFFRRLCKKFYKKWMPEYKFNLSCECYIMFIMNAASYHILPTNNIIPIFLDFPINMIDDITRVTKGLPVFFVTCKDIYNILSSNGVKNVRYMPLSISDKHVQSDVPKKTIDVIQFGRKNNVLHDYMLKYCKERPNVEYIYQTDNGTLTYISTTRGIIGKFDSRDEYFDLIKSSKISLVSTPGFDNSRTADFGNIDFVTPRFYESAASFCHMIGRYTSNDETTDLRLSDVCPNVSSYSEFANLVDAYLSEDYDWHIQREFVNSNLTSLRAEYIINEIEKAVYNNEEAQKS
ncbi:hypothetical protein [Selenomonas ruminantium]|uniref:Glycosyl transferases group 1 n=1 Tax=Selenomonas ruminantium TaxID=971 RepID=A0A1H0NZA5_SELRU|nr:hypothetical protein [Selenomonas ruminantium]SDO97983.1 hypothetical protein SAMN05216366_10443 [Selenomonas ruminantium]